MTLYYLSGPMAGLPNHNKPAFLAADLRLRETYGNCIVNPVHIPKPPNPSWTVCLRLDLASLLICDAVIVMPGWKHSRGATMEANQAVDLDMPVYLLASMLAGKPVEIPVSVIKRAYFNKHMSSIVTAGV